MVALWVDDYLVTFSAIYMVKMENDVVFPSRHIFYRWFVDENSSRRKLWDNVLIDQLRIYPNIEITIELKCSKILDNSYRNISGAYKFNAYRKNIKLSSPWISKALYKWDTVNGDLQCSKRILSNTDKKIPLMKEMFLKSDQPFRFINSELTVSCIKMKINLSFIFTLLFGASEGFVKDHLRHHKGCQNKNLA